MYLPNGSKGSKGYIEHKDGYRTEAKEWERNDRGERVKSLYRDISKSKGLIGSEGSRGLKAWIRYSIEFCNI